MLPQKTEKLGTMVHPSIPSTQEAKTEGLMFEACPNYISNLKISLHYILRLFKKRKQDRSRKKCGAIIYEQIPEGSTGEKAVLIG